ncbi:MAG: flippase-like domain-containing protein [Candidatus Cloacimonetes bacterium]|nr:flippase-like domain-containing protein [Candidatus Cloacimonadota bacterium]
MSLVSAKLRKSFPVIQLIISVVLLFFIVYKYHISFFKRFAQIPHPQWIFVSLFISLVLIPILAAIRWKIMLNFSGIREGIFQILKINFISIFWGIMLPSSDGFAAIRLYLIEKRHKATPGKAGSTVVVEKFLGFMLLCLIGIGFSFTVHLEKIVICRLLLIVMVLLIAGLFLLLANKFTYNTLTQKLKNAKRSEKVFSFIVSLHKSFTVLPFGKIIICTLPIMLLFQLITIVNVKILFSAYGLDIPILTHLALVPIIQIISLIPVTISGFGVREGAFVYFYQTIGVSPSIAMSVSIMNFLILTGVPALIGGIWSIISQISKKDVLKHA